MSQTICRVQWRSNPINSEKLSHKSQPLISKMQFIADTQSGHTIIMDGAIDGGGANLAPRPMELLLAGAGGCTAYDVVHILQKGRHQVTGCEVLLTATRQEHDPKVFIQLHLDFIVSGRDLNEQAVKRAVELSHEKYCSAIAMLVKTATISHDIEVVQV
jgi:putative redox protein